MARVFLTIYVLIGIIIIVTNVVVNAFGKTTHQFLSGEDWIVFMIACSGLAICESLDNKYGVQKIPRISKDNISKPQ